MSRSRNQTMTLAQYRSTVRKLHAAYAALKTAYDTAEYFDGEVMATALAAMQRAPDALRIQVCTNCNSKGYYEKPGDPYTSVGCLHPDVPRYDVKTGAAKEAG